MTTSALASLTYDAMKEIIGEELGLDKTKSEEDEDLLERYYQCQSY